MTDYSRDSSFNMGIAHLTRIDALLYDVASSSAEDNYESWLKHLNLLCREVFFLFNEDEMKKSTELENSCANAINEYYKSKIPEIKNKVYNSLVQYEYFIKQQLASRKMLMAFSKDLKVTISDLA